MINPYPISEQILIFFFLFLKIDYYLQQFSESLSPFMVLLNVIILHNVPQDNEAAHMRVQLQEVVTLPSTLDHICSCELLSKFFFHMQTIYSLL